VKGYNIFLDTLISTFLFFNLQLIMPIRNIKKSVLLIFVLSLSFFQGMVIYKTIFTLTNSWFWNFLSYGFLFFLLLDFILITVSIRLKHKYYFGIGVSLLLFSIPNINETIQFSIQNSDPNNIKVLSYNLSTLQPKRFEKSFTKDDVLSVKSLLKLLEKENPDIICFQEFHHYDNEKTPLIDSITSRFNYPYYFMAPVWLQNQEGYFGPIIFSKFPIVGASYVPFFESINRLVTTDIIIEKDTISVFNLHLNSMSIRTNIDSVQKKSVLYEAEKIYSKLEKGFKYKKIEIGKVDSCMQKTKNPIILCGDFNTFPYGFTYKKIQQHLQNTYTEKGNGFGFTLNIFPYIARIDQIFVSNFFEVTSHRVLYEYKQSDHYPILAKIKLNTRK